MLYLLVFISFQKVDGCDRPLPSLLQSLLGQLDFARSAVELSPRLEQAILGVCSALLTRHSAGPS
jgi:hypothetical protein